MITDDFVTGSRTLEFVSRRIGIATFASSVIELSRNGDRIEVTGTDVAVDLVSGTIAAEGLEYLAKNILLLALGVEELPLLLGIAVAAGAGIGATLLWDTIDSNFGITDKIEAFFNVHPIDIVYQVDGAPQNGVVWDQLPTDADVRNALASSIGYCRARAGLRNRRSSCARYGCA